LKNTQEEAKKREIHHIIYIKENILSVYCQFAIESMYKFGLSETIV